MGLQKRFNRSILKLKSLQNAPLRIQQGYVTLHLPQSQSLRSQNTNVPVALSQVEKNSTNPQTSNVIKVQRVVSVSAYLTTNALEQRSLGRARILAVARNSLALIISASIKRKSVMAWR